MNKKYFWATLSIVTIWIAVLFVGVFGPELAVDSAGGDVVRLPAAPVAVAFFAAIAHRLS